MAGDGWWIVFESIDKPSQSSEVEWGGVHHSEPKCHVDLLSNFFISWGGGVHHPEPKCHVDLRSNFVTTGGGGGGVHHLEPKCHVDLRSNFFIPGGGVPLQVDW